MMTVFFRFAGAARQFAGVPEATPAIPTADALPTPALAAPVVTYDQAYGIFCRPLKASQALNRQHL